MKILVKVKASSQKEFTKKEGGEYIIAVKEPAREGKANEAVAKALAGYFGVPRSRVRILSGHTFHKKVFEIV